MSGYLENAADRLRQTSCRCMMADLGPLQSINIGIAETLPPQDICPRWPEQLRQSSNRQGP